MFKLEQLELLCLITVLVNLIMSPPPLWLWKREAAKGYLLRHTRGKSETLHAQYINTKDLRVRIGTWNVAGRVPDENLEIDEWLDMEEPADIYILGIIFWAHEDYQFTSTQKQPKNRIVQQL